MKWCRAYRQLGVAGPIDKRRGGNRAFLTPSELERAQQQLETYTPHQVLGAKCYGDGRFWTGPDLAKLVERDYGIKYKSASSYRQVFDCCDFGCQRPGTHYRSRKELSAWDTPKAHQASF
jgi:transposase